jgi:hypothetical protein
MRLSFKYLLSVLISVVYVLLAGNRLGGAVEQFGCSHAQVVDFSQINVFESLLGADKVLDT